MLCALLPILYYHCLAGEIIAILETSTPGLLTTQGHHWHPSNTTLESEHSASFLTQRELVNRTLTAQFRS